MNLSVLLNLVWHVVEAKVRQLCSHYMCMIAIELCEIFNCACANPRLMKKKNGPAMARLGGSGCYGPVFSECVKVSNYAKPHCQILQSVSHLFL